MLIRRLHRCQKCEHYHPSPPLQRALIIAPVVTSAPTLISMEILSPHNQTQTPWSFAKFLVTHFANGTAYVYHSLILVYYIIHLFIDSGRTQVYWKTLKTPTVKLKQRSQPARSRDEDSLQFWGNIKNLMQPGLRHLNHSLWPSEVQWEEGKGLWGAQSGLYSYL